MNKRIFLAALLLAILALPCRASLRIKQPCSDGMVLQQNTKAVVWGYATPGSVVSVKAGWDDLAVKTKTGKDGVWKVSLQTPEASYTSYVIEVNGDNSALTINDVLIGEVWFAGGQSNMEIALRGYFNCPIEGSAHEVANPAGADKVRMYTEPVSESYEIQNDGKGSWAGADAAHVLDMSASAYFFAKQLNSSLDIPIGIIACPRGGSRVESWIPEATLRDWGSEDLSHERIDAMTDYHRPFKVYNAMLHPILGYTIKGFIWYQGCSNVGAHDSYVPHMQHLISQFRHDFGDDDARLPFYMVEIAPYAYDASGESCNGALLRKAQHDVVHSMTNCEIVVTNDLVDSYEQYNIHPRKKREIGFRLASLALKRDYGFSRLACYSPEVIQVWRFEDDPSKVGIRFTDTWSGVNREHEIKGLQMREEGGDWVDIESFVFYYNNEGGYMILSSPLVERPAQIRYAWGDFCPGNLANGEGLPFSPFFIQSID